LINKKYYFLLLFITRVTNTLDYIHKNSREGRKEKKRKEKEEDTSFIFVNSHWNTICMGRIE
jgi:hypothetical protein